MSKLIQEEQYAVLFWTEKVDIPIFQADTRSKKISFKGWPDEDFSKVDFGAKLASGEYDNGIAIRTGKTLSGKYYLIVLDFDGLDAVLAWFGNWEEAIEVAERTRIEWHKDRGRLHMFLLANRPVKNKKVHIKDSLLEIRCDRQAVFVSPSIHKDGNPYTELRTTDIAIINENQLLQLELKIDSLSEGYMSDEDKQAYIKWLEDPENYAKLGIGQGRHNGLVILGTSYYYRYSGEWKYHTDEQRRMKLWDWNLKLAVPKPEKEFNGIWQWIVDKHRRTRDEQHEKLREEGRRKQAAHEFDKSHTFSMYDYNIKASLDGNIWTEIGKNPVRWIVADSKTRVVYKAHQYEFEIPSIKGKGEQKQRAYKLSIDNVMIRCIPVSITKHESPLDFIQNQNQTNYTMKFTDTTGKTFFLNRNTIEQIMDYLKNEGYLISAYGTTEALAAIITAFREDGKLIIDRSINSMGLYFMCQDTFPVCVNEMKALNGQDPKAVIMIEMLKSAIETQESRSVMNNTATHGTIYPAFRQVNFSSNAPPPRDMAFRARLIVKNFTQKDSHTKEQKKAFHEFIGLHAQKLKVLGDFAIGYLCSHPEVLFKPRIEDVNWEEAAKEIITKFYELARLPRPNEWLDLPLTDDEDDEDYETDELNNTTGALRTCFLNHFNETYNRYIRNLGDSVRDSDGHPTDVITNLTLRERIDFCIDNDLTPVFSNNL